VLVALALFLGVGLVLGLTDNKPVGFAQELWRDLTGDLKPMNGVSALAEPVDSVARTYNVQDLPEPRTGAWATPWPTGATTAEKCGKSPADGAIVLRWKEPTRVRGLDVWAGLAGDDSERARQFLPKRLGVRYHQRGAPRDRTPDRQRRRFDTNTEVTSLVVTVADVYPNSSTPAEDLVAIGGIEVLHQP
jgi:hypothetical protein